MKERGESLDLKERGESLDLKERGESLDLKERGESLDLKERGESETYCIFVILDINERFSHITTQRDQCSCQG